MRTDARIVIIGTKSESSYAVCNYLHSRFPGCVFVFEQKEARSVFVRRRINKFGIFRVAGQFAFRSLAAPLLRLVSRARLREIRAELRLNAAGITGFEISSVNSPAAVTLLDRLQPAIVVLAGTRILGPEFIGYVRCPIVNIHAGITPQYRGVHGGYWALVEKRPELCGVTVHLVDAGIDTGRILKQAVIHPSARDNFATYPWIQLGVGLQLLADLLPDLMAGRTPCVEPCAQESRLHTHPTIWEYCLHRLRGGVK